MTKSRIRFFIATSTVALALTASLAHARGGATLGDDAYFFYDQYVVKGADKGMPFSWHQDSGYVVGNGGPVDHKPYLTCWCALDDTTVANGTVRIMPFSQAPETRDGIVPHLRQPGSNDLVGYTGDGEGVTVEVPA
ncbi:MAG: phytanoyl-CoA dioxygenase family protein, partial [Myxococcales bacterium]|nr:phytanoyl-CoA dioxygenase family protein [Myxococcales bacterium]